MDMVHIYWGGYYQFFQYVKINKSRHIFHIIEFLNVFNYIIFASILYNKLT